MRHDHPCSFCTRRVPCVDDNCHTRSSFICDKCNEGHLKGLGGIPLADLAQAEYRSRTKGGNP